MTITQTITTLPTAPDPATMTRDEFSTAAAASVLAQKAMVPELNTWAGQVNAIAATAVGDVATAIGAAAADTPVGADEFAWRKTATGLLKKVTFTNALAWFAAAASSALSQDFRLSLTTALPVTTADVTGATTIYAVPRTGNRIALYDGTKFLNYVSAEFSIALGTLTNDQGYDVFCYQNAGVPTLELLAWTNNNTRNAALAYSSGILIKSGDATRRYMGSFLTTSTTTTEDSATNRYLWNYYHRVPRAMSRFEISSWTYTTATLRQANNSTSNQLNFFVGLREDSVNAQLVATNASSIVGNSGAIGIGDNSVTAISALSSAARLFTANTAALVVGAATFSGPVNNLGKNYLAWLEHADASGTMTWYGATGNGKSGLTGSVMA